MAKNVEMIGQKLGATIVGQVPDTGGGALGAIRLAHVVQLLQSRLEPGQGRRPGRPPDGRWVHHPKVPMGDETVQKNQPGDRKAERRPDVPP